MCPGHLRNKQCGGLESSFCKSWACVIFNDGEWKWSISKPDLVTFKDINLIWYGPTLLQLDKPCVLVDLHQMKTAFTNRESRTRDGHHA